MSERVRYSTFQKAAGLLFAGSLMGAQACSVFKVKDTEATSTNNASEGAPPLPPTETVLFTPSTTPSETPFPTDTPSPTLTATVEPTGTPRPTEALEESTLSTYDRLNFQAIQVAVEPGATVDLTAPLITKIVVVQTFLTSSYYAILGGNIDTEVGADEFGFLEGDPLQCLFEESRDLGLLGERKDEPGEFRGTHVTTYKMPDGFRLGDFTAEKSRLSLMQFYGPVVEVDVPLRFDHEGQTYVCR